MRIILEMSGTSPLLMHNEQLADPANSFALAIAQLTSKSEKTPEDQKEIQRLEFMVGLLYCATHPDARCGGAVPEIARKEGSHLREATPPERQALHFSLPLSKECRRENLIQDARRTAFTS